MTQPSRHAPEAQGVVSQAIQRIRSCFGDDDGTSFANADPVADVKILLAEYDRLISLHALRAPQPGDPASQGAVAQVLLDMDYQLCDSMQLAEIMLKYWDVRWKAPALSSTERSSTGEK